MSITFLTPSGALLLAAVVLPLAGLVLADRRVGSARAILGLRAPRGVRARALVVALVAVPALLAVAAAQPALRTHSGERVRTDAQAFFVLDITRSMLAARAPGKPTRLERAKAAAVRLRNAIPQVPAGVGTLTDRVLPNLLPVGERRTFASTVRETIAIESPPPEETASTATTFDALGDVATQEFFAPSAKKRLLVVLTDGESRPFANPGQLLRSHGVSVVLVRFWNRDERIYGARGKVEPEYRPDPSGATSVQLLANAAGGRTFDEDQLSRAAATLRSEAGTGPTAVRGTEPKTRPLTPYVAAAALLPLLFVLRRRNMD
jgi:hypothetical protein